MNKDVARSDIIRKLRVKDQVKILVDIINEFENDVTRTVWLKYLKAELLIASNIIGEMVEQTDAATGPLYKDCRDCQWRPRPGG